MNRKIIRQMNNSELVNRKMFLKSELEEHKNDKNVEYYHYIECELQKVISEMGRRLYMTEFLRHRIH